MMLMEFWCFGMMMMVMMVMTMVMMVMVMDELTWNETIGMKWDGMKLT